eukprot:4442517-Pleurochrysis_carterae.AAC.5
MAADNFRTIYSLLERSDIAILDLIFNSQIETCMILRGTSLACASQYIAALGNTVRLWQAAAAHILIPYSHIS